MGLENPIHLAFLAILLLLVFGAKRLPEMGKSLGHGMRGFKDALGGGSDDAPAATDDGRPAHHELIADQPEHTAVAVPVDTRTPVGEPR